MVAQAAAIQSNIKNRLDIFSSRVVYKYIPCIEGSQIIEVLPFDVLCNVQVHLRSIAREVINYEWW